MKETPLFSSLKSTHLSGIPGMLFGVCVTLVASVAPCLAASASWTNGGGDNLWTTSSNWSAAYPNGTADVATFGNPALITGTLSFGGSITLQELVFQSTTVGGSLTIGTGSSQTVTFNAGSSYGTALLMRAYASGANLADTLTINANVAVSNANTFFYLYNNATLNLAAGNTVSLAVSGAGLAIGGTNSTGYGAGLGTLNFNADFNTANVSGTALRIEGGTVNWNVGTFTNSSTSGSLINVTGNTGTATLNFQKSLVSTTGTVGGISLGSTSTANNTLDNLYGTANGVVIGANISASNTVGTGGSTANINTIGANDTSATSGTPSTVTFSGNYTINDSVSARTHRFFAAANNTAIFSGVISSAGSAGTAGSVLQKTGAGSVTFSGTTANTTTLPLEVVAGTLLLQKTAGIAAISGNVQVDSGAVLRLGASNQIVDTVGMTLAGGTFDVGTFMETLGTLNVSATGSVLTLGSGAALAFADSSALTWTGTLAISTSGASTLRFGTTSLGLTSTQLSDITLNGSSVTLDASGYLTAVAVPEPNLIVLFGMGLSLLLVSGVFGMGRRVVVAVEK